VGGDCAVWVVWAMPPDVQMSSPTMMLKAESCPLYGGLTRVNDKCVVGLRWTFFSLTLFSFHTLVFRVGRAKNQILLLLLTSILVFILVIAICFVFNAFWSFFYFRFHPIYCILFNFFIQFGHHSVDWFFFNPFLDFFFVSISFPNILFHLIFYSINCPHSFYCQFFFIYFETYFIF
jgi:hypothetical protein